MKPFENSNKVQNISIIVVSVLLIAIALYGTIAYTTNMWPFGSQTNTKAPEAAKNPTITMGKPTVNTETKILHADAKVATTQQGNCKLTLSNTENIYTLTNTTEGVNGKSGCLEWNIGTSSIPAGEYDLEIKFIGKTQTASIKQKVSIK